MSFNFSCFIITEKIRKLYIDYALSCRIKHAGNKLWNAYTRGDFERIHEHGFERMCIFYERLGSKVCFFIYAIM